MSSSNTKNAIVYQIDFAAVASGKRIASTKRRVRWRFGFANMEALAAGETGTACRGEEHDVTLVWSISSGKRLILTDGQEVHYSVDRSGVFDCSWSMRGNHVLKIVAYAAAPMTPTPGWRQYDFFVDGQSFFNLPKVYRLGLAPGESAAARAGPARLAERGDRYTVGTKNELANLEAPSNVAEEEAYLQEAIRQSLEEGGGKVPAAAETTDLFDFANESNAIVVAAPSGNQYLDVLVGPGGTAPPYGAITPGYPNYSAPALQNAPPPPYGYPYGQPQPPGVPNSVGFSAPAAPQPYDGAPGFGAPGVPGNPFGSMPAPPPQSKAPTLAITTNGLESETLPQYVTPKAQPLTPSSIGFASPPMDFSGFSPNPLPDATPFSAVPEPAPYMESTTSAPPMQTHLTMGSLANTDEPRASSVPNQAPGSIVDQAYAKLVNMDNFGLGNPAVKRNNPFESVNATVGGPQSLADIKAMKGPSSAVAAPKDVMKAPGSSVMVVSGQQNGGWGASYGGGGFSQQQPISQQQQPSIYNGGGLMSQQQQPPLMQQYGGMPPHQQQQPMSYGGMPPMQSQPMSFGQPMGPPPAFQQPLYGQYGGQQQMSQQQPYSGGFGQPQPGYQ